MSFLGGAECSTAGNPLSQFTKHVQNDNSLQRDRIGGGRPAGQEESIRSRPAHNGSDQMMNDFLQHGPALSPFVMDQMSRELSSLHSPVQRTQSPRWASELDPAVQARMEASFQAPRNGGGRAEGFSTTDFARFQQPTYSENLKSSRSPLLGNRAAMDAYQGPMGMGYMNSMGMSGGLDMGMDMGMRSTSCRRPVYSEQQRPAALDVKGKSRMVELDDSNWEAQFAEMAVSHQTEDFRSDEANQAMEPELDELDRLVQSETDHVGDFESIWRSIQAERESRQMAADDTAFARDWSEEDLSAWDNFDSGMGFNTPFQRSPESGPYVFESHNPFLENPHASANPFEQGVQILQQHGNLSLAALAFEAAIQQDANHVEAWTLLGSAQAQNEKESPAIRALQHAVKLDPTNSDALMNLAVSYTNESYDSLAYQTLERWLSVRYPQVHPPDEVSSPDDSLGFSSRVTLHDRVSNLFIRAAQLSPSGDQMDPDVQVGLGVLFYGDQDYEKAVDCFQAALASSITGTVNRQSQLHLLWNRLGATLANSGRSEDAISAYEKALEANPNFVRARYNLGVSCINIDCHPEAVQHLLGALAMHRVVEENLDRVRKTVGGGGGGGRTSTANGNGNGATNTNDRISSASSTLHWGSGVDHNDPERTIQENESSNLYDTLRRAFTGMNRTDLSDRVGPGMNLEEFRGEFDF